MIFLSFLKTFVTFLMRLDKYFLACISLNYSLGNIPFKIFAIAPNFIEKAKCLVMLRKKRGKDYV